MGTTAELLRASLAPRRGMVSWPRGSLNGSERCELWLKMKLVAYALGHDCQLIAAASLRTLQVRASIDDLLPWRGPRLELVKV